MATLLTFIRYLLSNMPRSYTSALPPTGEDTWESPDKTSIIFTSRYTSSELLTDQINIYKKSKELGDQVRE